MKEATGELNITVIVVIIVAMLSFFFFTVIWPNIRTNFQKNTNCDIAICECPDKNESNGKCNTTAGTVVTCYYKDKNGNKQDIPCVWKG